MMKSRKIVIDIPEEAYKHIKENDVGTHAHNTALLTKWIANGTLLPEGAEILTKEAYSDLCLRASKGNKTGKWILVEMGDTNLYKCSLCGNRKVHKSPFCQNCGAKMMGVEE